MWRPRPDDAHHVARVSAGFRRILGQGRYDGQRHPDSGRSWYDGLWPSWRPLINKVVPASPCSWNDNGCGVGGAPRTRRRSAAVFSKRYTLYQSSRAGGRPGLGDWSRETKAADEWLHWADEKHGAGPEIWPFRDRKRRLIPAWFDAPRRFAVMPADPVVSSDSIKPHGSPDVCKDKKPFRGYRHIPDPSPQTPVPPRRAA